MRTWRSAVEPWTFPDVLRSLLVQGLRLPALPGIFQSAREPGAEVCARHSATGTVEMVCVDPDASEK
jgi:hypothetical protein